MTNVPRSKRRAYARTNRKTKTRRPQKIVVALTEAAEKLERLNDKLEALVHRGAR